MNLEQMRARLAEIVGKIAEFKNSADYNDDVTQQINELHAEFEGLKAKIESAEKVEAITQAAATSVRKVEASKPQASVEVGVDRRTLDPKAGFNNSGDFYRAVASAANGRIDKRLVIQGGMQEKIGEDGGYLIPADFRQELQKKVQGDESLLSKTRQFKTQSNNLVLPVNEIAPWDGQGIQAYWEGEAQAYQESKTKFGDMSLRLHKLTAMVRCTEELLEDAPALESYIKVEAPEAMLHKVNSAILSGDGVGKPAGILGSGFKYKVAKEGGQAADTILFENVNKMLGRIIPSSLPKAVWICNPAVLPVLRLMKFDAAAASPVPVYMPSTGVADAPFGTLFGRPIMPMMGAEALGDEGDLMLVDFSSYITAIKTAGIKSDVSTHVYFSTGETAFKFTMRIAGQCPFKAPVKTEKGNFEMSSFITLEAR